MHLITVLMRLLTAQFFHWGHIFNSSCLLIHSSILDKNSVRDEVHYLYKNNEPIQGNIRPFNSTISSVSTLGLFEGTITLKPCTCLLNT